MRKDVAIVNNTECWGNKVDGIKVRNQETHLVNCKIKSNINGAILMEGGKVTE